MTTLTIARHEANIAAKAARLFTTEGYTMKPMSHSTRLFLVQKPGADQPPHIVDVKAGDCTCGGHAKHGLCSHRLAVEEEVASVARWEAEAAARADWEAFGKYL